MEPPEYVKLAAVEDRMWYFRSLHAHVEGALARALGREASVADIGCGTGGLIRRLAPVHPGWHWTGVDSSPVACDLARVRSGAEIRRARAEELPFSDASFDAVVAADLLYHIDDEAAALREIARVLRRDGCLVVNVPAYDWLRSYHDEAVHGIRRYTRMGLIRRLQAAGFGAVRATYWNTLPFAPIVVRRKLLPAPRSGSDVKLSSRPVEAALRGSMSLERAWLRLFGRLPFGLSVFAVTKLG